MKKKDTYEDNLDMKDLVSIVVPIYNAAPCLETAINSLLNQTYKNIEMVLINDGSTDNSLNVIRSYQKLYHNIKVVNQKNFGPGVARNRGIEISSGTYLMFLDADDFFEESYCAEAVNLMKNSHSNFSCFGANFFNNKGYVYSSFSYKNECLEGDKILKSFLRGGKIKSVVWNKIYQKSFLDEFNIRFNSNQVNEDSLFVLKAASHANKINISPKILYNHRSVNTLSYANFITHQHFKSTLEVINTEKKYLQDLNLFRSNKPDFDIHIAKIYTHMLYLGATSNININYYIDCANIILRSELWLSLAQERFWLLPFGIKLRISICSWPRILWFYGRFLRIL